MEMLPDTVLMELLHWIPPRDLLCSVSQTSKRFAEIVNDDALWLSIGRGLLPSYITKHQIQRCCLFAASDNKDEHPRFLEYGSVLCSRDDACDLRRASHLDVSRACLASTTDRYTEMIENVLSNAHPTYFSWETFLLTLERPEPWLSQQTKYWSSRSTASQDTNETLVFATRCPSTLISEVWIKPLIDPFLGDQKYTWKSLSIKAYRFHVVHSIKAPARSRASHCVVSLDKDPELGHTAERDEDTIKRLLDGRVPSYESVVYETPSADSVDWQKYTLPPGVVANVVTVSLHGKNSRQFETSGFYCCVEGLAVRGIPLYESPDQAHSLQKTISILR